MPLRRSNHRPSKTPKPALAEPPHQWSFEAIGTGWWIGIYQPLDQLAVAKIRQAVAARIEQFDKTYSRFRADSMVMQIATSAGTYQFPPDSDKLFQFYQHLYDVTDGLVTPLIGQVLSDVGYDATYSLRPGSPHTPPQWEEAIDISGNTLIVKRPVILDFGAAGKGYLVDILSGVLANHGIDWYCVDAGGDMRCHTAEPLRIGLEHPADPTQAIGVASIANGAICGSAGNRRAWGKYHHIMNPVTLQPVQNIQAVWVTAADALTADGLATALFFTEPAELHTHFNFAHCIVYSDNTMQCSADFPAEFFA